MRAPTSGCGEANEELKRAYEDGLVDRHSIDWQDIEQALAMGDLGALQRARRSRDPLIADLAWDTLHWDHALRNDL